MLSQQKIELYKVRKFGDKMNATVEFIRQNFIPVFKVFLFIFLPIATLEGILLAEFFGFVFSNISNLEQMATPTNQLFTSFGVGYFGFLAISIIGGVLAVAVSYNFMKHYEENFPSSMTPKTALDLSLKVFLKLLGLSILLVLSVSLLPGILLVIGALSQSPLLIFLGVVLFIFPGIYLGTTLSLSYPVVIFEGAGVFEAISRSFVLIREKFWSTFGLLFVTYIAQSFVAAVFAIPFYVFYFIMIFTMVQSGGLEFTDPSLGFKVGFAISFVILIFGNLFTSFIPLSALTFQYGNLVELKESPGIIQEIEQLGEEKREQL